MATININGSSLGTSLQQMLMCDEILPGSSPSYQICKSIFLYHPLGLKIAESPIAMAQSQERIIAVPESPEDTVREAFQREWRDIDADKIIFNVARLGRVYGISSVALMTEGVPLDRPVDFANLAKAKISFNVFDPLNTAGSLVLNQNPNNIDFLKYTSISVQGQAYHPSRTCIFMNEDPIYIGYTTSAFGYVGRSVYQRSLYPLKSFVQSLITDDMVMRKTGVLIAKMKPAGSVVDRTMSILAGVKRNLLKEAETNNVLSISSTDNEEIESLNMQNADGPYGISRKNILENIAVSADMPAKLLNSETFAEGFGEGTEDAKQVARYVDRIRISLQPLYEFFDDVVMARAWNAEFYAIVQEKFPDYEKITHKQAFYRWKNSFKATWPNLLTEPDSEKIKVEDVKLRAAVAVYEVLRTDCDPDNKARLADWLCECFSDNKLLFPSPLTLDTEALANFTPAVSDQAEGAPAPFRADSVARILGTPLAERPVPLTSRPRLKEVSAS